MKKLFMALPILLLLSGKIQAIKGANIKNMSGETIKARIDYGLDKGLITLKPDEKRFFKTSKHGRRGIYWETKTHAYESKKYLSPEFFTIKKNGEYIIVRTILGVKIKPKKDRAKETKVSAKPEPKPKPEPPTEKIPVPSTKDVTPTELETLEAQFEKLTMKQLLEYREASRSLYERTKQTKTKQKALNEMTIIDNIIATRIPDDTAIAGIAFKNVNAWPKGEKWDNLKIYLIDLAKRIFKARNFNIEAVLKNLTKADLEREIKEIEDYFKTMFVKEIQMNIYLEKLAIATVFRIELEKKGGSLPPPSREEQAATTKGQEAIKKETEKYEQEKKEALDQSKIPPPPPISDLDLSKHEKDKVKKSTDKILEDITKKSKPKEPSKQEQLKKNILIRGLLTRGKIAGTFDKKDLEKISIKDLDKLTKLDDLFKREGTDKQEETLDKFIEELEKKYNL